MKIYFVLKNEAEFLVSAPANKWVICKATVHSTKMSVPHEITFKSGRVLRGNWTGVSSWGLETHFAEAGM
jgi:hypothetical protein